MNLAKAGRRSFNDLLLLYAMERFLVRLAASPHSGAFVLKGAMLLRVWDHEMYRTTRDIDLLGRARNDPEAVARILASVCSQAVEPDGLVFDPSTLRAAAIVEQAEYAGVRTGFLAYLGNARINMQVDIGFGDAITPAPVRVQCPALLQGTGATLNAYPPETVIAEKFQVMLVRGDANSRMKDFHDLWWLASTFEFQGRVLARAVGATCNQRGTSIPEEPRALTMEFAGDASKRILWRAFRDRVQPTGSPEQFEQVVQSLRAFLRPVAIAVARGEDFEKRWTPANGWG